MISPLPNVETFNEAGVTADASVPATPPDTLSESEPVWTYCVNRCKQLNHPY